MEETNDIVLNDSVIQIMDAMGGIKTVLFEFTKLLKIEQLTAIHTIISKEQRKYNSQINNQLNISKYN